jgi:hypothetical protein
VARAATEVKRATAGMMTENFIVMGVRRVVDTVMLQSYIEDGKGDSFLLMRGDTATSSLLYILFSSSYLLHYATAFTGHCFARRACNCHSHPGELERIFH